MFNAQKQFAELSQANLEKSLRLTNIALAGAERLFQLQVGIARDLMAENAETAKSLAQVKNVQELVDLQKTLTQPSVEKNIAVARTIYEAASSTQAELNKLIEEQVLEFNKNLVSSLEQAAQQAPASGAAVNMFKNAVESANTAFETVQKTSQRIANDLTQATVAAVESGVKTVETVARASKSA